MNACEQERDELQEALERLEAENEQLRQRVEALTRTFLGNSASNVFGLEGVIRERDEARKHAAALEKRIDAILDYFKPIINVYVYKEFHKRLQAAKERGEDLSAVAEHAQATLDDSGAVLVPAEKLPLFTGAVVAVYDPNTGESGEYGDNGKSTGTLEQFRNRASELGNALLNNGATFSDLGQPDLSDVNGISVREWLGLINQSGFMFQDKAAGEAYEKILETVLKRFDIDDQDHVASKLFTSGHKTINKRNTALPLTEQQVITRPKRKPGHPKGKKNKPK